MKIIRRTTLRPLGWAWLCTTLLPGVVAAPAPTNLPPAAVTETIDFDRDIRPIFEAACLRCHGPEKPRSHFRLDNRASALQGGNANPNDLVPGNSRKSLLLNYVAREVQDMEMPPPGKGTPLTSLQISRLRAWIDQGANWSPTNPGPRTEVTFIPAVGGAFVHGNRAKFRELENTTESAVGGAEQITVREQINPNEKIFFTARIQAPAEDYKLKLAVDETDLGFVHAGFEQWRKYYANTGGYNALSVPQDFQLGQDLYVDNGRLWADFGLALPNRPLLVFGYEYQYQHGNQSSLAWGGIAGQNLYPALQAVHEDTHIIKFDFSQDFHDWHLADRARVEFNREAKNTAETGALSGPPPGLFINTQDSYHHVQGMNTLGLDKQLRDWWYLSSGWNYSRLEGSDFFNQTTLIPAFSYNNQLASQAITLKRESEIFSVSSLFRPLSCLNLSLVSQNEWTREDGFGSSVPDLDLLANTPVGSRLDKFKSTQEAGLHYTQIPFTVVFSEARFEEADVSEFQQQEASEYVRHTDAFNLHRDIRAGFNTSPWRWFSFTTQYHDQSSATDYHHLTDIFNGLATATTNGYPAFIEGRNVDGDGLESKCVLRPANWISTTFSCDLTATDYHSRTDPAFDFGSLQVVTPGGMILDGNTRAHTYGFSTTLTPVNQLYFTTAFTCSQTRIRTANNDVPSVAPYHGTVYTMSSSATYALNLKTALQAGYIVSRADYDQNPAAPALPFGLNFTRHELLFGLTRQFSKRVSGVLHYEFSQYSDPAAGHTHDFSAHGVFASIAYKWQ